MTQRNGLHRKDRSTCRHLWSWAAGNPSCQRCGESIFSDGGPGLDWPTYALRTYGEPLSLVEAVQQEAERQREFSPSTVS